MKYSRISRKKVKTMVQKTGPKNGPKRVWSSKMKNQNATLENMSNLCAIAHVYLGAVHKLCHLKISNF